MKIWTAKLQRLIQCLWLNRQSIPKMAHKHICQLNPEEAALLERGIRPSCSGHGHISRDEALLKTRGAGMDARRDVDRTGDWFPVAVWAKLSDGSESKRHIVLFIAREWQVRGGVKQLLPLGATRQRRQRTRMHVQRPVSYSLTQCADVNGT